VWLQRRLTRRIRTLPDYLVIGAQRCGTTSLHRYLERHPCVAPAARKEIHFFDENFGRGLLWYRTYFPTAIHRAVQGGVRGRRILSGEASPYYVFHPHAPRRVFETLPTAKLVLLLRNPVDRAYSHYHHEVRWGFEKIATFEEAIEREPERLEGETERILADETYSSFNHNHYSYLARGHYLEQVRSWRRFFPAERMLILESESFYEDTPRVFREVLEFLELPAWEAEAFPKHNEGPRPAMDPRTRERLARHFRPHNDELGRYLGVEFGWNE